MQDAHQKLNDISTILLSNLSISGQYFVNGEPGQKCV